MNSLVAKKYTNALVSALDAKHTTQTLKVLHTLSNCFNDIKFKSIINSPIIPKQQKETFILSLANTKDKKIISFLKILNQKNRLYEIPHIYDELKKHISSNNNEFELIISSSFTLTANDIKSIKKELENKLGVSLYTTEKHTDIEGIKLFVDGISVETSLFKDRFSNSIKNHILKAF